MCWLNKNPNLQKKKFFFLKIRIFFIIGKKVTHIPLGMGPYFGPCEHPQKNPWLKETAGQLQGFVLSGVGKRNFKLTHMLLALKTSTTTKYTAFDLLSALWACLFVLMLYVPVNIFSVTSGHFPVFLGWTSTTQRMKSLGQGHNTVTPVSLKLATLWSQV